MTFSGNIQKQHWGQVFNSRVYQVGHYLREKGQNMTGLIGYDLLRNNTELLKSGEVTYLIDQRPLGFKATVA